MYYSTRQQFFTGSYSIKAEEIKKIDKYLDFLEKSGVGDVIYKVAKKEGEKGGRPEYNPYDMLAMIIYNFAFTNGSLREIEDRCAYDLRSMYIMENRMPTYATIGNFIKRYIEPHEEEIFSKLTKEIFKECGIEMTKAYIDGTKIEANANKYKFVWKPTKYHKKQSEKVIAILKRYNIDGKIKDGDMLSSTDVGEKIIEFDKLIKENPDDKKMNKDYMELVESFVKINNYEEKERICGPNRNSYYKTDKDATAMCLKTDYYAGLGSNMHAAYNVQIIVINGIITSYLVTQDRNDIKTLIPTVEKHQKMYGTYPKALAADAGYGSYDNYSYMDDKGIKNFVKYFTWEGNVSGKKPSQYHLNDNGSITCLNGNIGYVTTNVKMHKRKANSRFFKVTGCNKCSYSIYCKRFMKKKDDDFKIFEIDENLQKYIQQSEENLLSKEGIEMRVNRSIQVEGTFGNLKQNLGYDRFRRRSIDGVSLELMLTSLGINIRKLFAYYNGDTQFNCWSLNCDVTPEKFKKPSAKRLANKVLKSKEKSLNAISKDSYKYKK